jgi:transcription initiation factor TFIIB
VTNAYTTLNTELGLPAQPVTPSTFVPRLASEFDVSDRVRHRAERLAAKSESTHVTTSVHPSGFAAACLYRAGRDAGRHLTQSEVAAAANVSATTIRNHRDALDEVTV